LPPLVGHPAIGGGTSSVRENAGDTLSD
jgi:hypothetical protein